MTRWVLVTCLFVVVSTGASAQELSESPVRPSRLDGLDESIEAMMGRWQVPGLAIAVVEDTRIVFAKGYGVRDIDTGESVSKDTLFAVGSISKSFTVTGLGMLADENRLDWDRPVIDYLPTFRLKDPAATLQITSRDLVTHRSGLPRHDGLWYGASFTRGEMLERLRHLEPSHPFRSVWQYQNLMFLTAGMLAESLAGQSWEQFTRERILNPLGMSSTNFSVDSMQTSRDFAAPHLVVDEEVTKVPFRNIDAIGPAGSLNSSVSEMIRYVQLHLNNGSWGNRQLLSTRMAEAMRRPHAVIPRETEEYEEVGLDSYGMGLVVGNYRGHKVAQHGGGIDGFIALMSFMPSKSLGLIILTNQAGDNPVPTLLSRTIYDRMLDLQPIDWVARAEVAEKAASTKRARSPKPRPDTVPSHALDEYAGVYEHPGYGRVRVLTDSQALTMEFNGTTTPLEHFHYDMFASPSDPLNPLEGLTVTFLYNKKGEIDRVLIPMEPAVDDIEFSRIADEAMTSLSYVQPLLGVYRTGKTEVTVALRQGAQMTLHVRGEPTYELVPERELRYQIKGLEGYSVEFVRDGENRAHSLTLHQPNGSFIATRQ